MKRIGRLIFGVLVTVLAALPMSAIADIARPIVQFEKAVHFEGTKGTDVVVPPGVYRVDGGEKTLQLTPDSGGSPLTLNAGVSQSAENPEQTIAEVLQGDQDEVLLSLLSPNGQSWISAGSLSGIRGRGNLASAQNQLHFACTSAPSVDEYLPESEALARYHAHYQMFNGPECTAYRAKLVATKRKESLLKCIDSVRNGPERKKVNLFSHEFNCKPATIIKRVVQGQLRGVTIKGRLSHHMGWYNMQTDEQVEYQVEKEYDAQARAWKVISKPVIKIKEAISFRPLVAEVLGYGLSSLGAPIPPVAIEFALDKMVENATGNWEKAAEKTVAAIALKVYSTPPGN